VVSRTRHDGTLYARCLSCWRYRFFLKTPYVRICFVYVFLVWALCQVSSWLLFWSQCKPRNIWETVCYTLDMTFTVLIYIKPDARDWPATPRRFCSSLWQSIVDACGVGVRTCREYFRRSLFRQCTSPSLGVVTVRLPCEYVGGRRVAEHSVRVRSMIWNWRFCWNCVQKGDWNS